MAQLGQLTVEIMLTSDERETLARWARHHSSSQALALRCRIVLACPGHCSRSRFRLDRERRPGTFRAVAPTNGPDLTVTSPGRRGDIRSRERRL